MWGCDVKLSNFDIFAKTVLGGIPEEEKRKVSRHQVLRFLEKIVYEMSKIGAKKKILKILILEGKEKKYCSSYILVHYLPKQGVIFKCFNHGITVEEHITANGAWHRMEVDKKAFFLKGFLDKCLEEGRTEVTWDSII